MRGVTLVLAQLPDFLRDVPPPELIPDSPRWQALLVESPWAAIMMLVLAGLIGAYLLNRGGQARRAGLALFASVAAAAGLWLLSATVTTSQEQLRQDARSFLVDCAAGNGPAIRGAMLENATFRFLTRAMDLPVLTFVTRVESTLGPQGQYRLRAPGLAFQSTRAVLDGPNSARTQSHVRGTVDAFGFPFESWVLLRWRRNDPASSWRVSGIEVQRLSGVQDGYELPWR